MNWWNNPTFLTWLGIFLIILTTFISLYFQSEKFSRAVLEKTTKVRLIFEYHWKTFFLTGTCIIGIFLVRLGYPGLFLIIYAVLMTLMVTLMLSEKRQAFEIASCKLGNLESEKGRDGLKYIKWEDGNAVRELRDGDYIRRTDIKKDQGYIYFSFDEKIAHNFRASRRREVYILVEYLDNKNYGEFHLHYDSNDKNVAMPAFKRTDHHTVYTGTSEWKIAVWRIKDGKFRQSEQQLADFRIRAGSASSLESPSGKPDIFDVYIKKVVVVAA